MKDRCCQSSSDLSLEPSAVARSSTAIQRDRSTNPQPREKSRRYLRLITRLLDEGFVGEIEQVPPRFSAIKVDGQRAYDLARKGEEVEMKARNVTIYALRHAGLDPVSSDDASAS